MAGVAEVWVVDVGARGVYTQVRKALIGTALSATTIPGLSLATERVF